MYNKTTKKPTRNRSLASAKKVGLRGIEDLDTRVVVAKEVASVIPFLIKTTVVLGIGYYLYSSYTNRFVKLKENNNYPIANVTEAQAKGRADGIANSKTFWDDADFGGQYQATAQNLAGLNYNGFIRVYNAFGHQGGTIFSGDLNLIEFIKDQFSAYEVQTLSTLLNGVFFKGQNDNQETNAIIELFNAFPQRIK